MPSAREIQNRIKSIQDTQKITNAMYMISSTKLKKAKKSLDETEPYFYTLQTEIGRVVRHMPDMEHIYLDNRESDLKESVKKYGYIIVTADKGMAGSYNHNVLKKAQELYERKNGEKQLFVVGELGRQYCAAKGIPVTQQFHYTAQNPTMHRARTIAENILDLYNREELDEVDVVYTGMVNSIQEEVLVTKILPLQRSKYMEGIPKDVMLTTHQEEFIMWPSPEAVLESLVENYVTGFIYGALVESYSSEQNARMLAMEAANKSAGEMLKNLSVLYNRVRQAAITQELNEVIGGAKALKRKKKR